MKNKKKKKRSYRKHIKYRRTNKYRRSIKRKTKRKKSKKSPKKNYKLIGGMKPGPAPPPVQEFTPPPVKEPVSSNFRQSIERIISEADSIDPQKIIEYLTSVGAVSIDGYSDKIASPLLSRLGDIQIHDFESLDMSFPEIFYSFINLLSRVSDKLPSVYDAIALDSKVHYMELLLENGLCDDSTMILYYDIKTGSELTDKRSLKTRENIELLAGDGETTYYIKTPFAGASACAIQIESRVSTLEDLVGLIPDSKYCIGRFYGLIIQKHNPKFYDIHGEIRCCCFKGQIKSISNSDRDGYSVFPMKILGINKSVYLKLLDKNHDIDTIDTNGLSVEGFRRLYELILEDLATGDIVPSKDLLSGRTFTRDYSGINSEKLIISGESVTELSLKCDSAYTLLKSGLILDGSHHRIDLIKSRDTDTYIINEIENINFGVITANALHRFGADKDTLLNSIFTTKLLLRGEMTEDKYWSFQQEQNPVIKDIISGLNKENIRKILIQIKEIIESLSKLNLRDLLLLFD